MSKVGHLLNNSVVSRIARGPGFESRSGHDFFLPCDIKFLCLFTTMGHEVSSVAPGVETLSLFTSGNQNQNCLLAIRPRTIIHQDLWLGELVPSPHKRSKFSN